MLLNRSILQVFCAFLLLTITICCCQQYENDYNIEESDFSDTNHPDYSKYYSLNTPTTTNQGIKSAFGTGNNEFSNFFNAAPKEFSASQQKNSITPPPPPSSLPNNNNQFAVEESKVNVFSDLKKEFPDFYSNINYPKDYFEESKKRQISQPQSVINYPPQQIHKKTEANYKDKTIKKLTDDDEYNQSNDEDEKFKISDYSYSPTKSGKLTSTVSHYPSESSSYYEKLDQAVTPTPYQKYSFQPTSNKFLKTLLSTAAPYNPTYSKVLNTNSNSNSNYESQSPSDNKLIHLKDKNCKRVKKHDKEQDSTMNCFICENPETSEKYQQCSFTAEQEPVNYYSGSSERYSVPAKPPNGFRYKRFTEKDDPYEYIKSRSVKASSKRRPVEAETKNYGYYKPEVDYDDGSDKSYSELQSDAIKKDPSNCRKVVKKGLTCTICKDSKSGGNYEQCSYSVEPTAEKYAYVSEKKYDSDDDPEEGYESQPIKRKNNPSRHSQDNRRKEDYEVRPKNSKSLYKTPKYSYEDTYNNRHKKSSQKKDDYEPEEYDYDKSYSKISDDDTYDSPKQYKESQSAPKKQKEAPLYESYDDVDDDNSEKSIYKEIDDYHSKLFPEETQQSETLEEHLADSSRKNVEEVLAEFSKKDRSACKKSERNGMTCYLCVDKNGIQNEECMYVSESKPKSSQVAYREIKQSKSPKNGNQETAPTTPDTKRKRFFKKVTFQPTEPAPTETVTKRAFKSTVNRRRTKVIQEPVPAGSNVYAERINPDTEPNISNSKESKESESEEGVFSAETQPVYSKALGITLPKYMVVKSEFEKEFDEFASPF